MIKETTITDLTDKLQGDAQKKEVHPLRAIMRKAVRTALKRAESKAGKLMSERENCDQAEYLLECGEIIKANLDEVKRGMTEVVLPDMFHPGETRTIELEEHLKPMDNAKKYFKRQRKMVKGVEKIEQQLEKCRTEIESLQELLEDYEAWLEQTDVDCNPREDFAQRCSDLRIHIEGLQPPQTQQQRKNSAPIGVREFVSHDGMTIYVGKSARDNDRLSIRIARGNDWWFHVANMQGSHVVVRSIVNRKTALPLPQETLLDAAHLAVYYSKARKATRADVHYTQSKNLRKGKGVPAGQVTVVNGKTLSLRIEQERLARLLEGDSGE